MKNKERKKVFLILPAGILLILLFFAFLFFLFPPAASPAPNLSLKGTSFFLTVSQAGDPAAELTGYAGAGRFGLETSYLFSDYEDLYKLLLATPASADTSPRTFYLGIDIDKANASELLSLAGLSPKDQFRLFPKGVPLQEWNSFFTSGDQMLAYRDLAEALLDQPNISILPQKVRQAAETERLRKENLRQIETAEYDSLFLSMFPIDNYREEDFRYFEGIDLLKITYSCPDYASLSEMANAVKASGHEPGVIYLGLDPAGISSSEAVLLTKSFPGSTIKIFPKYLSLEGWKKTEDPWKLLDGYESLTEELLMQPNVIIYPFFSQEWIIGDRDNYVSGSDSLLCEEISRRIFLYSLFTDEDRSMRLPEEETPELFTGFRSLLTKALAGENDAPSLSQWTIVFFGDSVIGNFTDQWSIPGYVQRFSGAVTYNCGYGGASAAMNEKKCLPVILDAFLSGDTSKLPEDCQAGIGLTELFASGDFYQKDPSHTMFVLHFGINDYFGGFPLDNPGDPYDITTCGGAVRNAISQLQTAYPESSVLLVIPNHVHLFHQGTEIPTEGGAPYQEYISVLEQIAEEYGLPCLDDYHDPVFLEKRNLYLSDAVHPTEYGRYRIAFALMRLIAGDL